jgi:hypothetical protein
MWGTRVYSTDQNAMELLVKVGALLAIERVAAGRLHQPACPRGAEGACSLYTESVENDVEIVVKNRKRRAIPRPVSELHNPLGVAGSSISFQRLSSFCTRLNNCLRR